MVADSASSKMHALDQSDGSPGLNSPIRLLIAEDTVMGCQLLRDGLKRARLGLREIHLAVGSSQILELCASYSIDVALISEDLQDGAQKGLEIIEVLRGNHASVRSVLLVRRIRPEVTLAAFRNGAKGVFCRKDSIRSLGRCIAAVRRGQVWANSEQLEVLLQALIDSKPIQLKNFDGACLLTKREDQVAALVAEGLTNREIAKRLELSEHTISNYLFKMYEKLGISSRVEFVLYICGRRQQSQATLQPRDAVTRETRRTTI